MKSHPMWVSDITKKHEFLCCFFKNRNANFFAACRNVIPKPFMILTASSPQKYFDSFLGTLGHKYHLIRSQRTAFIHSTFISQHSQHPMCWARVRHRHGTLCIAGAQSRFARINECPQSCSHEYKVRPPSRGTKRLTQTKILPLLCRGAHDQPLFFRAPLRLCSMPSGRFGQHLADTLQKE